jgi:acyl-CoA synthetase (NDP forming)
MDLRALISPKSVAVIGAAPPEQGLRGRLFEVIRGQPFVGDIFPVSRSLREVQGAAAYPSIGEVPGPVDLALIIIPAEHVPEELERCGAAGVKAAVILSSGFAEEPGEGGARRQAELRRIAERFDMAVLGPNSEGLANLDLALAATFSPVVEHSPLPLLPPGQAGRVAVIAQSGGLGFSFYDRGRPQEIPFGSIIITGNEASLEASDVVEHLLSEGKTDVFLMLIESFRNPDKLKRVAEMALRAGKPLIVNKIGRSDAGRRAAASHTAALAGAHSGFQAVARRYGMLEAFGVDEMNGLAQAFLAKGARLPLGKRVVICTGSGGGGGMMADCCSAAGLIVPELDAPTRATIDAYLPAYGTSQNPVDGTAQAISAMGYARFTELALASPEVDAGVVVLSARSPRTAEFREDLERLKASAEKPIFLWTYTLPARAATEALTAAGYPLYVDAEHCARSIAALADYREARDRFLRTADVRTPPCPARAEVTERLRAAGPALSEAEAGPLLAAYGVGWLAGELARSPDEALAAWKRIGGKVALKVQSPDILHKTEAGAVALNVQGREALLEAYDRVLADAGRHAPGARVLGVLVQPMARPGREVIVGVTRDEAMGPLIMLGLGGIQAEVLNDVVFAPLPLVPEAALDMIGRLRGAALLGPHRGQPAADVGALSQLMADLSRFAMDHEGAIAEIDLNPVIVHAQGQGVSVADALILKS